MDDLLQAIRRNLADANYYPALFLTVILPSVCAALESEDGQDSRDRYIAWYDRYGGGLSLTGAGQSVTQPLNLPPEETVTIQFFTVTA